MPKGHNTYQWLVLSSTDLCGRSSLGDYCKIHLAGLRKGSGTKPCLISGKDVVNKFSLCQAHAYENEKVKAWQQNKAALDREYHRLATMDIF